MIAMEKQSLGADGVTNQQRDPFISAQMGSVPVLQGVNNGSSTYDEHRGENGSGTPVQEKNTKSSLEVYKDDMALNRADVQALTINQLFDLYTTASRECADTEEELRRVNKEQNGFLYHELKNILHQIISKKNNYLYSITAFSKKSPAALKYLEDIGECEMQIPRVAMPAVATPVAGVPAPAPAPIPTPRPSASTAGDQSSIPKQKTSLKLYLDKLKDKTPVPAGSSQKENESIKKFKEYSEIEVANILKSIAKASFPVDQAKKSIDELVQQLSNKNIPLIVSSLHSLITTPVKAQYSSTYDLRYDILRQILAVFGSRQDVLFSIGTSRPIMLRLANWLRFDIDSKLSTNIITCLDFIKRVGLVTEQLCDLEIMSMLQHTKKTTETCSVSELIIADAAKRSEGRTANGIQPAKDKLHSPPPAQTINPGPKPAMNPTLKPITKPITKPVTKPITKSTHTTTPVHVPPLAAPSASKFSISNYLSQVKKKPSAPEIVTTKIQSSEQEMVPPKITYVNNSGLKSILRKPQSKSIKKSVKFKDDDLVSYTLVETQYPSQHSSQAEAKRMEQNEATTLKNRNHPEVKTHSDVEELSYGPWKEPPKLDFKSLENFPYRENAVTRGGLKPVESVVDDKILKRKHKSVFTPYEAPLGRLITKVQKFTYDAEPDDSINDSINTNGDDVADGKESGLSSENGVKFSVSNTHINASSSKEDKPRTLDADDVDLMDILEDNDDILNFRDDQESSNKRPREDGFDDDSDYNPETAFLPNSKSVSEDLTSMNGIKKPKFEVLGQATGLPTQPSGTFYVQSPTAPSYPPISRSGTFRRPNVYESYRPSNRITEHQESLRRCDVRLRVQNCDPTDLKKYTEVCKYFGTSYGCKRTNDCAFIHLKARH